MTASAHVQNFTVIGRLISGRPDEMLDKNSDGRPLTDKQGKPRNECRFGVAVEKRGAQAFYQTDWGQKIYMAGAGCFPHLLDPQTKLPRGKFSWKVIDGDSQVPNEKGNKPCDVPEWRGCFIIWFKNGFPPGLWRKDPAAANGFSAVTEPDQFLTGYYVEVAASVDGNMDTQKPGVYVNPNHVCFAGYGPVIANRVDPSKLGFGTLPAPAGMSTAPLASGALPQTAPGGVGGGPAMPLSAGPTVSLQPSQPAVVAGASVVVVPHPGILQPPAPPPAPPAPPAGPQLTLKANGATWDQLVTAGWNEVLARQQGLIV